VEEPSAWLVMSLIGPFGRRDLKVRLISSSLVLRSQQALEVVSFGSCYCYFLMVAFSNISIARCHTALKSLDPAPNCFWNLYVFTCDNARIDIPCDEMELVLATGIGLVLAWVLATAYGQNTDPGIRTT